MTPEALIYICEQAGIILWLEGEKVKFRGHEAAVARFLPVLKEHREALKALLSADEQEYYDERAAIAEYDGGLSRMDAEALAMTELQAQRNKRILH